MHATPDWQAALDGRHLLVSGFGQWGGGLYDLTSGRPEALDDLPTSGLAVGGGRAWRLLRAPGEQTGTCELLSYDEQGVRTYHRLDEVRDPHDVCWFDGTVHLSSSWDDAVWRLAGGQPELAWQGGSRSPGPVPDAWHVNSLTVAGGVLHACAFGRFDRHKSWKSGTRRDTGFVVDLGSGRDVLRGLAYPHTPRKVGRRWYVCESRRGTLTECDERGTVLRRAAVGRFTRGLAVVGGWALVGGNAHRRRDGDRAELAVVDLAGMAVVGRIALPCAEVYEVLPVPPGLARGLAAGFGANPARAVEQRLAGDRPRRPGGQERARVRLAPDRVADDLARAGEPASPGERRGHVLRGSLPVRVTAGRATTVTVTVVNGTDRPLATVAPCPLTVGARWFPVATGVTAPAPATAGTRPAARALANPAVPLPRVVHPGERVEVAVPLEAPEAPGTYLVRVAFRQRGVGWFGVRVEATVEAVAPRPAPAPSPAAALR